MKHEKMIVAANCVTTLLPPSWLPLHIGQPLDASECVAFLLLLAA